MINPMINITRNIRKKAHHMPALKMVLTTEQPGAIKLMNRRESRVILFIQNFLMVK